MLDQLYTVKLVYFTGVKQFFGQYILTENAQKVLCWKE